MSVDHYDSKPWLSQYSAYHSGVMPQEFDTVLDAFLCSLQATPDDPLIWYFDGAMTFREVDNDSTTLAALLHEQGFEKGDRLGLYLQNDPAFIIGLLAAWKLGGVAVAINPMNKARELTFILHDSGARVLLCLDSLYVDVVERVIAEQATDVSIVITTSMFDGQTTNDHRVLDEDGRRAVPKGVLDLREVLRATDKNMVASIVRPGTDDIAMLTYTSGTTGKPKGAMNTHGNMAFNAQIYRDWVGLTPSDSIMGIAPLFHVTGAVAHVALALMTSCPLVLTHRFHPEVVLDVLRQKRPTFTIGAITAFVSLMNTRGATKADFSSFKAIYSGGAPISPAIASAFESFTGHYIYNVFGMTETCSPTHMVPFGQRAPVDETSGAISIGVPIYNTSVRILDDHDRVVPIGELGEIVDRGPQVMKGYWRQPEVTESVMKDGWLRTGDIGFMDGKGWFYLVDRKKDMINVSGYKVWPREVEDVLYSHPAVREAAVVGVSDDYRGETVKAVVSLKPGFNVTEDELLDHCKANLAAYKYPRILQVIDELPKTASGKLLRRELR
jgi:long-chain acyl-CoA synthetase